MTQKVGATYDSKMWRFRGAKRLKTYKFNNFRKEYKNYEHAFIMLIS